MRKPSLLKPLRSGLSLPETGNKANSLLYLHKFRFRIPSTYILTTSVYYKYLENKRDFLEELRKELLCLPDKPYAVRSSATTEDSEDFTFAGQFKTFTYVAGAESLLNSIQEVWESAYCFKETEYHKRSSKGKPGCAVIIQEMIISRLAGVSFSRNPITNQQEIVIEAVEGPGEDLVQKGVTPLRWKYRNKKLAEGDKDHKHIDVIARVAADTSKLKKFFRNDVDIEWVFDGKDIYYVQFRPITGIRKINIYSNKLAKEMLPGQIKPLVWSINIPMVNGTWIRLLSEITGELKIKPEELAKSFYYRTYFNVAALSDIFREFGLSTSDLENLMLSSNETKPSFKPGIRIIRHVFRIIKFIRHKLSIEKYFEREFPRLKSDYEEIKKDLEAGFLLTDYNRFYSELNEKGKSLTYLNIVIPIMMQVYNKRLKKKLEKAGINYDHLDFGPDFPELRKLSPIASIKHIRNKLDLLPFKIKEQAITLEILKSFPEAEDIINEFEDMLRDFGHFSDSGTDFSIPKWHENPEKVFSIILKTEYSKSNQGMMSFQDLKNIRNISGSPFRRLYQKAGRFKVYREQISSLFILGHGLFRFLYLNVGKELKELGIVEETEDIFYLSRDEIERILQDLKSADFIKTRSLIDSRKKEMELTSDYLLPSVIYGEDAPLLEVGKTRNHYGVGSSSGIFRGISRVIKGPDDFESVKGGEVLIIPFSDVSWTPILTLAGAIVSETGGLLSHCSIIAREMGIPALVSVENACAFGNGLTVTVDGSNGLLTIHDYE